MHSGSVQDLIDAAIMFCGTPDQVYAQIVDFCEYCGGMGNLIMMGHAGMRYSLVSREVIADSIEVVS